MLDLIAWYLGLQVTAIVVWPLVARALPALDERGWVLAKVVGALGLAWLVWVTCMLTPIPYTRATIALLIVLVGSGAWLWLRRTDALATERQWLRTSRPALLVWEGVFAAALVFFALLRAHDPAIAGTEKPMDMAFLNGFITAERLPTQDTWLSGYGVPYYYFGYFIFATLAKLSGVAPGAAYNLAAATVPALALVTIASLAWSLVRAIALPTRWAAVAAVISGWIVVFAGNLSAPLEFLVSRRLLSPGLGPTLGIKQFAQNVQPGVWPPDGAWWWRASRIIPNTQPDGINEFPFFSALLSDFHPHFVALPFEVLVLTIIAVHLVTRGASLLSRWTQGLAALSLGALLTINTWDIAPFWGLYVIAAWIASEKLATRQRVLAALAAPVGGALLFAPYFVGYGGPPLGLGLVTDRTPLGSMLVIFGPQIALLALLGIWMRLRAGDPRGWWLVAAGVLVGAGLAIAGEPTLGLLVALLLVLLPWPGLLSRLSGPEVMVLGLAAFAGAMLLGVEVLFLRDTFGTRMNTVFKFHYNVWLLSGIAAGVGTVLMVQRRGVLRWAASGVAVISLLAWGVYPVSATLTRLSAAPAGGITLNGSSFLTHDEAAATDWLRSQAGARRLVIAEAVGGEYSQGARLSTFSGAATVLGWPGHELQWRGPQPVLSQRERDLDNLYRGNPSTIRDIIARYGIQFVVVGDFERQQYGPGVSTRFDGLLPVAFRSGTVTIYRG